MSSENSSSILPPVPVQDQTKDLLRVPTKDHPTTKHSSPISSTECPSDLELRRLVWSKEYRSLLNSTNRIRVSKAPLNSDSNNLIPLKTVSNGIFDPAILTPPRRQPVLDGQSVQPILKSTDEVANVMGHKDFSICPVFFTYVLFMNRSIAGILIVLILIKLDGLFSCCRPKFPTLTRIRSFEGI
ncbi:hypothetical protein NPIL_587061 [Nephila pilipes]|uniref:Uncharacterized protein n=1 Tax=Nephila pilipes TaxID=299642 RepID=A0A8X6TL31_NEPPI|nr:hypothetical protein NPIL_587061 [Nephila pilipes]